MAAARGAAGTLPGPAIPAALRREQRPAALRPPRGRAGHDGKLGAMVHRPARSLGGARRDSLAITPDAPDRIVSRPHAAPGTPGLPGCPGSHCLHSAARGGARGQVSRRRRDVRSQRRRPGMLAASLRRSLSGPRHRVCRHAVRQPRSPPSDAGAATVLAAPSGSGRLETARSRSCRPVERARLPARHRLVGTRAPCRGARRAIPRPSSERGVAFALGGGVGTGTGAAGPRQAL